jgi:glycosyltransferase involved in cell wall biosynthesis
MQPRPRISLVVPVFDEQENLAPLHAEIARAMEVLGRPWEVLYVDDRSRDASLDVLVRLWRADPHVRVLRLRVNSGQTAALAAGFEHARGAIVVTLDADLQNDPADIPRLVAALEEGADLVAGWRRRRRDAFLLRRLPSFAANRLIAWVTGVPIHDTGCTLKAFRREVVERMPLYAEQHRFLPAISAAGGARIRELEVNHRPRRFGRSKYGLSRAARVLADLFTIKLIASFSRRPLQYFVLLALPFALLLAFLLVWGLTVPEAERQHERWVSTWTAVFAMLTLVCVYFVLLGLLAELAVKASGLHRGAGAGRVLVEGVEP